MIFSSGLNLYSPAAVSQSIFVVVAFTLLAKTASADDEIFEISTLPDIGQVVTADLADFDDDGRKELMLVTLDGMPPDEVRTIHIDSQTAPGRFAETPDLTVDVPPDSAIYDTADLDETPDEELIVLRADRVTVMSLSDIDVESRDWMIEGPTTLAAAEDERGFERFRLAYDDFDAAPWLLVPQFGALSLLSADGKLQSQLDIAPAGVGPAQPSEVNGIFGSTGLRAAVNSRFWRCFGQFKYRRREANTNPPALAVACAGRRTELPLDTAQKTSSRIASTSVKALATSVGAMCQARGGDPASATHVTLNGEFDAENAI